MKSPFFSIYLIIVYFLLDYIYDGGIGDWRGERFLGYVFGGGDCVLDCEFTK